MKLLLAIALLISAFQLSAQQQKLGHIDITALIEVMPETAKAKTALETQAKEIESEMTSLNEQYRKAMTEFNDKMSTYSETIRQSKEQEIRDLIQRVQTFRELSQTNFEKARDDAFAPIVDKANSTIKTVAQENGYTYIFNSGNGIIPFVNGDDILPLAKKKLGLQ